MGGGCERGLQMLLTTAGAFAAFTLMTIAVGTDYWLYSRGVCRSKGGGDNDTVRKNEEVMTHSGLWRTCCLEGTFKGVCKIIDHFPEDADYEQDTAEYLLRIVRASSLFPILSVGLLFLGGICIAASEFYKSRHDIVLSSGIFFVAAGLSNVIGIIVYISANAGDPAQSDTKKNNYSYGWSFYFGALSFIIAETMGVLAVHIYIDKQRLLRVKSPNHELKKSTLARIPSYRYRFRRRSSSRSTEPRSRDSSPIGGSQLQEGMERKSALKRCRQANHSCLTVAKGEVCLDGTDFITSFGSFPPSLESKIEDRLKKFPAKPQEIQWLHLCMSQLNTRFHRLTSPTKQ